MREPLVSTLVRADYSDRASILVVKDPAGFLFRNHGLMRVPVEQALQGGGSDCPNRTQHQMLLMINLGERAGSGLPKIRQGWVTEGGMLLLLNSFEPYDQPKLKMFLGGMLDGSESVPEKTLEKTPEKILGLLAENPTMTIAEMARVIGKSNRAVEQAVRKLREAGKIKRIGPDKEGHWEVICD